MTVPSSFLALAALSFSFVTVTTAAPLATAGDFNTLTTNETTSEALLLSRSVLNKLPANVNTEQNQVAARP